MKTVKNNNGNMVRVSGTIEEIEQAIDTPVEGYRLASRTMYPSGVCELIYTAVRECKAPRTSRNRVLKDEYINKTIGELWNKIQSDYSDASEQLKDIILEYVESGKLSWTSTTDDILRYRHNACQRDYAHRVAESLLGDSVYTLDSDTDDSIDRLLSKQDSLNWKNPFDEVVLSECRHEIVNYLTNVCPTTIKTRIAKRYIRLYRVYKRKRKQPKSDILLEQYAERSQSLPTCKALCEYRK